jgi:tricarballylate dehydrogenase
MPAQVARDGGRHLDYDVVVVGAGNAALCAALSANEAGAKVLVLERAPKEEYGGNTRFSSGSMRFAYNSGDDIRAVIKDLSDEEFARLDFGSYPEDAFFDDMFKITSYRTDPALCEQLVKGSYGAAKWLAEKGVRFLPRLTHAYKDGEIFRMSPGLSSEAVGGGDGLVEREVQLAVKNGVVIHYGARAMSLVYDGNEVKGVRVKSDGVLSEIKASAVVLACGGFEANPEWRARYLGPGWDLVKVRGTRFNTGDGLKMALDIGAAPFGNWSGCNAVAWDANAPEFGDLAVMSGFQKHSYPYGIMVNAEGKRFADEGADVKHYTYGKYGEMLIRQPGQFAWQVFDSKVLHLLREDYRIKQVSKVRAESLEELAHKMEGVDPEGFLAEVRAFNAAVQTDLPFKAGKLDCRSTTGLAIPKSNWALKIDEPPFEAYHVCCGITFTFGGLRIHAPTAQVVDLDLAPIPGLYAAGEIVGGIFSVNYPGGTGLTSGAVFGRMAGASAAREALGQAAAA